MQTFEISCNRMLPVSLGQHTLALRVATWLTLAILAGLAVKLLSSWVVLLLVLAPPAEEVVFRGGLQEQLLRLGSRPEIANLLTAGVFAAAHGLSRSWTLAVLVFVPACVLGVIYQQRRSVVPCIAAHCGMNLIWCVLSAAPSVAPWVVTS